MAPEELRAAVRRSHGAWADEWKHQTLKTLKVRDLMEPEPGETLAWRIVLTPIRVAVAIVFLPIAVALSLLAGPVIGAERCGCAARFYDDRGERAASAIWRVGQLLWAFVALALVATAWLGVTSFF